MTIQEPTPSRYLKSVAQMCEAASRGSLEEQRTAGHVLSLAGQKIEELVAAEAGPRASGSTLTGTREGFLAAGAGRAGNREPEALAELLQAVSRAWGRAWRVEARREAVEVEAVERAECPRRHG